MVFSRAETLDRISRPYGIKCAQFVTKIANNYSITVTTSHTSPRHLCTCYLATSISRLSLFSGQSLNVNGRPFETY